MRWRFGLGMLLAILTAACGGGEILTGAGGSSSSGVGPGAGGAGGAGPGSGGGGAAPTCKKSGDMPVVWAKRVVAAGGLTRFVLSPSAEIYAVGNLNGTGATFDPDGAKPKTLKPTVVSGTDGWIGKYDAKANLEWVTQVGGSLVTNASDVALAQDGSVRAIGGFTGISIFGKGEAHETQLHASGHTDLFVAKYDDHGKLVWVSQAGGSAGMGEFAGAQIRAGADGSVRVLGTFAGTVTFDAGGPAETTFTAMNPGGEGDKYLAKYGADGKLDWAKHIVALSNSPGLGLDSAGNAFAVFDKGATFEPGTVYEQAALYVEYALGKYDASGKLTDVYQDGGEYEMDMTDFSLRDDGSYTIGATFTSTVTLGTGQSNAVTIDPSLGTVLLARYTADGKFSFVKTAAVQAINAPTQVWRFGDAGDGTMRVTGNYDVQAELGLGDLQVVQLMLGPGLIGNYDKDGTVVSGKNAPAPLDIVVDPGDESLRLLGVCGPDPQGYPTTFDKGEPTEIKIADRGIFIAKYATCP